MDYLLAFKVKHEDTLRRFVQMVDEDGQLDINIYELKAKITNLFSFPLDATLLMTYIDEDGDMITLDNDEDLFEATRQFPKVLRIDCKLNGKHNSSKSIPLGSSDVLPPFFSFNGDIDEEWLKNESDTFKEALSKLSIDLASKASLSSLAMAELSDSFTNMGMFLKHISYTHPHISKHPKSVKTEDTKIGSDFSPYGASTSRACRCSYPTHLLPRKATPKAPFSLSECPAIPPPPCDNPYIPPPCDNPYIPTPYSVFDCPAIPPSPWDYPYIHPPPLSHFPPLYESSAFNGLHKAASRSLSNSPSIDSSSYEDAMMLEIHEGVFCNGCGVVPIAGPRFKSKIHESYNLCSVCLSEFGKETDYIRIYTPEMPYHPRTSEDSSSLFASYGPRFIAPQLDSKFIFDTSVFNSVVVPSSTLFTKIWRIQNSGSAAWPPGTQLVWLGGNMIVTSAAIELEIPAGGVPVNGELDIKADLISPESPGNYNCYWMLAAPSGFMFGQEIWFSIKVDDNLIDHFNTTERIQAIHDLNLNASSADSNRQGFRSLHLNNQNVTDGQLMWCSTSTNIFIQPAKLYSGLERNDKQNSSSSLVGENTATATPEPLLPLSLVVDEATTETSLEETYVPEEVGRNNDLEFAMLKELKEMGFMEVSLNQDILRKNGYDLEQSVDALCDFGEWDTICEWDPVLEELKVMGFTDAEMNKKLLRKNNGSIKGVVMDLLTGRKD